MAGMADPTFDKFFDLPVEIRDQIISYLCLVPNPIQIGPTEASKIPFPHDLLLSHPLLYAAGSAVFYEQNRFVLNLQAGPRAAVERAIYDGGERWLLGNSRARRRLRHLELSPGRLGNVFQTHVSPAVADMILNGALRHLKVVLYPTSSEKVVFNQSAADAQPRRVTIPRRDDTFARSEPFRALLRLLADPDLETAELFVDPIHRGFWCQYHDGVACWKEHRKGPWQLLLIDWRRLAVTHGQDHELSIVRVGR